MSNKKFSKEQLEKIYLVRDMFTDADYACKNAMSFSEKLKEYESKMISLTPSYSGMPSSHNSSNKLESAYIVIEQLKDNFEGAMYRATHLCAIRDMAIGSVENPQRQRALVMKYIERKSYDEMIDEFNIRDKKWLQDIIRYAELDVYEFIPEDVRTAYLDSKKNGTHVDFEIKILIDNRADEEYPVIAED